MADYSQRVADLANMADASKVLSSPIPPGPMIPTLRSTSQPAGSGLPTPEMLRLTSLASGANTIEALNKRVSQAMEKQHRALAQLRDVPSQMTPPQMDESSMRKEMDSVASHPLPSLPDLPAKAASTADATDNVQQGAEPTTTTSRRTSVAQPSAATSRRTSGASVAQPSAATSRRASGASATDQGLLPATQQPVSAEHATTQLAAIKGQLRDEMARSTQMAKQLDVAKFKANSATNLKLELDKERKETHRCQQVIRKVAQIPAENQKVLGQQDQTIDTLGRVLGQMKGDVEGHRTALSQMQSQLNDLFELARDAGKETGDMQGQLQQHQLDREKAVRSQQRSKLETMEAEAREMKLRQDVDESAANVARAQANVERQQAAAAQAQQSWTRQEADLKQSLEDALTQGDSLVQQVRERGEVIKLLNQQIADSGAPGQAAALRQQLERLEASRAQLVHQAETRDVERAELDEALHTTRKELSAAQASAKCAEAASKHAEDQSERSAAATTRAEQAAHDLQISLDEALDYGQTLMMQVDERGRRMAALEEDYDDAAAELKVKDAVESEATILREQVERLRVDASTVAELRAELAAAARAIQLGQSNQAELDVKTHELAVAQKQCAELERKEEQVRNLSSQLRRAQGELQKEQQLVANLQIELAQQAQVAVERQNSSSRILDQQLEELQLESAHDGAQHGQANARVRELSAANKSLETKFKLQEEVNVSLQEQLEAAAMRNQMCEASSHANNTELEALREEHLQELSVLKRGMEDVLAQSEAGNDSYTSRLLGEMQNMQAQIDQLKARSNNGAGSAQVGQVAVDFSEAQSWMQRIEGEMDALPHEIENLRTKLQTTTLENQNLRAQLENQARAADGNVDSSTPEASSPQKHQADASSPQKHQPEASSPQKHQADAACSPASSTKTADEDQLLGAIKQVAIKQVAEDQLTKPTDEAHDRIRPAAQSSEPAAEQVTSSPSHVAIDATEVQLPNPEGQVSAQSAPRVHDTSSASAPRHPSASQTPEAAELDSARHNAEAIRGKLAAAQAQMKRWARLGNQAWGS